MEDGDCETYPYYDEPAAMYHAFDMERDMNQSALPTLCRAGCGFYGSVATDGFCSKCFKDALKRKQDPGQSAATSATPKSVDAGASHDLVAAVENLVTSGQVQASCSSKSAIVDPGNAGLQGLGKAEVSQSSSDEKPSAGETLEPELVEAPPSTSPQKQKNRCDNCRKRIGLTGFQCRCGGLFCATHRYSDMHQCAFDYKALGEQEIRKNNPVVKTEKVVKL